MQRDWLGIIASVMSLLVAAAIGATLATSPAGFAWEAFDYAQTPLSSLLVLVRMRYYEVYLVAVGVVTLAALVHFGSRLTGRNGRAALTFYVSGRSLLLVFMLVGLGVTLYMARSTGVVPYVTESGEEGALVLEPEYVLGSEVPQVLIMEALYSLPLVAIICLRSWRRMRRGDSDQEPAIAGQESS